MISEADFNQVMQHVRLEAQEFLRQPNNSSKKFCDPQQGTDERAKLPALARFVFDLTGATIQSFNALPAREYASWLFAISDVTTAIYLDEGQMHNWHQRTGMPVEVQKVRSIVHEVGHLQFSVRLLTCPPNQFVPPSYPEEEEKAWVYAMTFLGVVMGDYSRSCR